MYVIHPKLGNSNFKKQMKDPASSTRLLFPGGVEKVLESILNELGESFMTLGTHGLGALGIAQ